MFEDQSQALYELRTSSVQDRNFGYYGSVIILKLLELKLIP